MSQAERDAQRALELAAGVGIPPAGAVTLLREDPLTQGPKLFAKHCASCHRYDGHDGMGKIPEEAPSGSDLKGFASRQWLTGFFDPEQIDQDRYFGGTDFAEGKMVKFVKKTTGYDDEERRRLQKVIKALSAEARLKSQREQDLADEADIEQGRLLMLKKKGDQAGFGCVRCHRFHDEGELGKGPDLSGYGSREWLTAIIFDPEHERFYEESNDRMPRFGEQKTIDEKSIELIADWLRGQWYVVSPETVSSI